MTRQNKQFYQVENLIRNGSNDAAKSLLQQMENPCDLADISGSTLLHFSVDMSNVTIIQHLIELGCNINAKNCSGETPLMLAVKNRDSRTVEVLLKHNADIYLASRYSGMGSLQLAVRHRIFTSSLSQQEDDILEMFVDKINEDFRTDERKAASILSSDDNVLKLAVVVFGSAELARFVLENGYAIDYRETKKNFSALHWAVIFGKFENAKLLIEHGASVLDSAAKHSPLYYYTEKFERVDEQSEVLRLLIERSWTDSRDRDNVEREMEALLSRGNAATVRTTLTSADGIVPMKFGSGRSLPNVMLDNENIDLVDLLSEFYFSFDVDEYSDDRGSNLTRALGSVSPRKVECLLKLGADMNLTLPDEKLILCDLYRKVISSSEKTKDLMKIGELLLQYGVNVQFVLAYYRESVIEIIDTFFQWFPKVEPLFKIVVAHLALLEALDRSALTYETRSLIQSKLMFKRNFILCAEQLENMKCIEVYDKVTLYELLTVGLEKLVVYARKQEFLLAFNNIIKTTTTFEPYYVNTLQHRVRKALDKIELDKKAAVVIQELTCLPSDTYYFIIYKIISFLSVQDLNNLCHVNSIFLRIKL